MKQSEEKTEFFNEVIQEWKKLNVYKGRFEFSCGGDSMNETELTFYDNDDNPISKTQVLNDYFEDEIYKKVEFYEASDGHYIGEMGTVYITLNDDEDDFEWAQDDPNWPYEKEEGEMLSHEGEEDEDDIEQLRQQTYQRQGSELNLDEILDKINDSREQAFSEPSKSRRELLFPRDPSPEHRGECACGAVDCF